MTPYKSLLATISKNSVKKYVYSKTKKKTATEAVVGTQSLTHDIHVALGDSNEDEGDVLDEADYREHQLGSEEEEEEEGEVEATESQQCGRDAHLTLLLLADNCEFWIAQP